MGGILSVSLVLFVGAVLLASIQHRFTARERRFLWAGFVAHIIAAFAQVWITTGYYGGDMLLYFRFGVRTVEWVWFAPTEHFPELLKLIFQLPAQVGVPTYGTGSTHSMHGITALFVMLLGESLYGVTLLFSLLSFVGTLAIYSGLRQLFPSQYRSRLLIATLLLPSVVFWSSGILKESVAMLGVGLVFLGMQGMVYRRKRGISLILLAIGVVPVSLVKSYILLPMFIAFGAWYYWQSSLRTRGSVAFVSKPLYLIGAVGVAIGAVVLVGELFPRFAFESLGEELRVVQEHGQRISGGSNYSLGNPGERSLLGQLAFAPIALLTALFRPFIFEAHNIPSFINALETTILLVLVVRIALVRSVRNNIRVIISSPTAIFCVVFVLLFGMGVGLGSTNLGTVSRYRIPMMPFFASILVVLLPHGQSKQ